MSCSWRHIVCSLFSHLGIVFSRLMAHFFSTLNNSQWMFIYPFSYWRVSCCFQGLAITNEMLSTCVCGVLCGQSFHPLWVHTKEVPQLLDCWVRNQQFVKKLLQFCKKPPDLLPKWLHHFYIYIFICILESHFMKFLERNLGIRFVITLNL